MAPKKAGRKSAAASDNESDKETKTTKDKKVETPKKDAKKDTPAKDTKDTEKKETKKKNAEFEPVTVDRGQIAKVFEHLHVSLLKEFLDGNNVKKVKTSKKATLIDEALQLAAKKGQASLFAALEKDDLKAALETLSKEELDHDNKSKMMIEVKKHFTDSGHKKFFAALPKETLVKFAAALEFEEEDASKEELESALEEEILINGLRQMLSSMAKDFIVDVSKQLNLPHSGTKKTLETGILAIAYPHLSDEDDEEGGKKGGKKGEKSEKEKVVTDINKINKDSTFEDLFQYYTKDLVEFADKNGLRKVGTKKELANRILQYYKDPEAKGVKPGKKGERLNPKRKKKSEAQKKKEAKEKREAKKKEAEEKGETTTKKTDKAEKPAAKGKAK